MQRLIDTYLRESKYEYSILKSRLFKGSRDELKDKTRLLRDKGKAKNQIKQVPQQIEIYKSRSCSCTIVFLFHS